MWLGSWAAHRHRVDDASGVPESPTRNDPNIIGHLWSKEPMCKCRHAQGSHCHGFSNQACMWCTCRIFDYDRKFDSNPSA